VASQAPQEAARREGFGLSLLSRRCRERGVAQAGHKIRIGRCTVDSSERLGRCRWVVGGTLLWLARYRRLKVRYERRADVHHQAFLDFGCALIYWNHVQRYC
jgi:hypothetical protein